VRPHQIAVPSPAVSGQLDNSRGRVTWWAFRETTGIAGAAFRLWDGTNNGGRLMAPFGLNIGESVREWPGLHSLYYETGLYLEVISGTFEGVVQVISWDEWSEEGIPVVIVGDVTVNVEGP
jgi:hypothetical protein